MTADHPPTPAPAGSPLLPAGAPTAELVLRSATLPDGRTADVALADGVISRIDPAGQGGAGSVELDLTGQLLLPALVEPHAHLDKALTAAEVENPAGDLAGAVTAWLAYRGGLARDEVVERATRAVRGYSERGATAVRSHVDIGTDLGLRALDALIEVRAAVADLLDLQLVAFTDVPLTGVAGADNRALLRDALAAGADAAGGCPHLDPDPVGYQRIVLDLAAEYRRPIDLHTDETLDPAVLTLESYAALVTGTGFTYGAVASHCVSLGMQPPEVTDRVCAAVAAAGIAVVCLPQTNLYLQARDVTTAPPRGLTAVRALRAAGVTVAAGGDNVQDPFNSIGRGDPFDTASLLILASHDDPADAYAAVSRDARAAIGLPAVQVRPGAPAELLAVPARTVREAVAVAPPDRLVIHRGRVVAHTRLVRA